MYRRTALRIAGRLAILAAAVLLATGSVISLAFTDCAWGRGEICGGDLDMFFEGYVTGTVLMALSAGLGAFAVTQRRALAVVAAVAGFAGAVVLALYFERAF